MTPKPPNKPTGTLQQQLPVDDVRARIQLDLAPSVVALLEHASKTLGAPKSQLILQALLQALPAMVDQADLVRRRAREVSSGQVGGKR